MAAETGNTSDLYGGRSDARRSPKSSNRMTLLWRLLCIIRLAVASYPLHPEPNCNRRNQTSHNDPIYDGWTEGRCPVGIVFHQYRGGIAYRQPQVVSDNSQERPTGLPPCDKHGLSGTLSGEAAD